MQAAIVPLMDELITGPNNLKVSLYFIFKIRHSLFYNLFLNNYYP